MVVTFEEKDSEFFFMYSVNFLTIRLLCFFKVGRNSLGGR